MFNLVREILISPFGSFASVFALFAMAFWLVYWITKHTTKINESHRFLEKENEKASNKIEEYCGKQDKNMDEIRKDISFLKAMIEIFKSGSSQQIAQSHSPVSLTEYGENISKDLDADNVISRNWDKIYKDLEANIGNKNAYDIQQYCIETATVEIEKFIDNDAILAIKSKAYRDGRPLAFYAPIFGIKIRDKYLEIKGINISEIDTHDPQKGIM